MARKKRSLSAESIAFYKGALQGRADAHTVHLEPYSTKTTQQQLEDAIASGKDIKEVALQPGAMWHENPVKKVKGFLREYGTEEQRRRYRLQDSRENSPARSSESDDCDIELGTHASKGAAQGEGGGTTEQGHGEEGGDDVDNSVVSMQASTTMNNNFLTASIQSNRNQFRGPVGSTQGQPGSAVTNASGHAGMAAQPALVLTGDLPDTDERMEAAQALVLLQSGTHGSAAAGQPNTAVTADSSTSLRSSIPGHPHIDELGRRSNLHQPANTVRHGQFATSDPTMQAPHDVAEVPRYGLRQRAQVPASPAPASQGVAGMRIQDQSHPHQSTQTQATQAPNSAPTIACPSAGTARPRRTRTYDSRVRYTTEEIWDMGHPQQLYARHMIVPVMQRSGTQGWDVARPPKDRHGFHAWYIRTDMDLVRWWKRV